jgi:antirestriction protein ArdC
MEKTNDDGEKPNLIPFLKEFIVFNVSQCVGLPEDYLTGEASAINLDQRDEEAQAFISVTGADFREGHGEAYYAAGADFIAIPSFESFKDADCFYATSFHEIAHWTGHKSRLDRDLTTRFGTSSYAAEELVAELARAFLCAEFGINKETRHASYIANWIELLKRKMIELFSRRRAKHRRRLTTSGVWRKSSLGRRCRHERVYRESQTHRCVGLLHAVGARVLLGRAQSGLRHAPQCRRSRANSSG